MAVMDKSAIGIVMAMTLFPQKAREQNMKYSKDKLEKIFHRTDGRCHICRKDLILTSHGNLKVKGNWEVEHSKPRASSGTDHINNLFPACISCNRKKSTKSSAYARGENGFSAAPLSKQAKSRKRADNTFYGSTAGLIAGTVLRTPPLGLLTSIVIGAAIGFITDPERE